MPKSKENMYATDTLMDERELVLRLIDGDEDAFCELYAAYKNRLLYFAMKFVKSREFAEDIFQDAFTVVWQSRRFINPDASFSSYLYTIVRNRILNQIRDMANEDKLKEHILSHAVDSANETNNKIFFDDLKDVLSRALEQLQLFQCTAKDILQIIEKYFIIRFIGRINRMRKDMLFQLIFIRHIPYLIKDTIAYNRI